MFTRKATDFDLGVVYSMMCDLEEKELDFRSFEKCFITNLRSQQVHYLLAVANDQAAGFISVGIQQQLHHAGAVAEIQELFVLPEYRHQRIASLLFDDCLRLARSKGARLIEVATQSWRTDAFAFYQSQGMQATHTKFTLDLQAL